MELSREHALALLYEAAALAAEGQTELAKRRRARWARLLYRMAPGSCAKIGAIQTQEGAIASDPQHMADVLRRHWASVFSARGVDLDLLRQWVADDIAARRVENNLQEAMRGAQIERKHVATAVSRSNDSAPGPDGVPYLAWRLLKEDAIDVLYDAIRAMAQEDGPFHMTGRYADFNHCLLLFSQEKNVGEGDMASVYSPEGVRPLNVTNTDNRLVASSIRVAIEPILGQLVTMEQRGFMRSVN